VGLFQWISTKRKIAQLEFEVEALKRTWIQVQQDWDATSARVTKVLRRIATAEAKRVQAEDRDEVVEEQQPTLPLTTLTTSPDRAQRIRDQLAAKGR
jgi:hypothetical protein